MSAAAAVNVATVLTPRRIRALEEVAAELAEHTRRPVTAAAVLARLVDAERWGPAEDLDWIPGYRAPKVPAPAAPFKDPTLWPGRAPAARVRAFQWSVRQRVDLAEVLNAEGGAWCICEACHARFTTWPAQGQRRIWWLCPNGCNDSKLNHGIVAYLWRHYFAGGPAAPKVDELALEREDLAKLADVDVLDGASDKGRFRCQACRSTWTSERMTWWRCPRGCNVSRASERRMLRAYHRRGSYVSREGWWCRRAAVHERWAKRYRHRAWRAALEGQA